MESLSTYLAALQTSVLAWLTSPAFYVQLAGITGAVLLGVALGALLRSRVPVLARPPEPGSFYAFRTFLHQTGGLLGWVLVVVFLGVAAEVTSASVGQSWLVRIAQSLSLVFLLLRTITRFVRDSFITAMLKWVGAPVATLHVFGWLDEVTAYLDGIAIEVGNVRLSAYVIGRTIFAGSILFWLGRISNQTGKRVIRSHEALDASIREVVAKLFEIALFLVIFVLILQVMGLDLTALAIFGGALGIGLGFGLQHIAANFISGLIILLDRSVTIGDYVEMEDGLQGRIRALNMRSATLETFDGKDIVVPNERFVSSAFTNWTHYNQKQRYEVRFSVAYDTDLPPMLEMIKEVVARHPQVFSGPAYHEDEQPDAEIERFGESGIDIKVEFWMEGVDDGPNRVCADLLLMIWSALREHGITMPFPQREVRILGAQT